MARRKRPVDDYETDMWLRGYRHRQLPELVADEITIVEQDLPMTFRVVKLLSVEPPAIHHFEIELENGEKRKWTIRDALLAQDIQEMALGEIVQTRPNIIPGVVMSRGGKRGRRTRNRDRDINPTVSNRVGWKVSFSNFGNRGR